MALLQAVQEREEGAWIERLQPFVERLRRMLSPEQPRYRLFVCYRRKSWDFTHRLVADLRTKINADIFIDFGIDNTDFEESILRHLRQSDCVLLVVSEHTFDERIHDPQDWMRREIGEALRLGKWYEAVAFCNWLSALSGEAISLPTESQWQRAAQG
ncbi:MAG: hypothetical protein CUN49_16485, partial [Candidatus Thermofonsia Clade 1 bacterium]